MRWKIVATVEKTVNGWTSSPQVPTFWVDASSSRDACCLVHLILNPHGGHTPHFGVYCEETGEYSDSWGPDQTVVG